MKKYKIGEFSKKVGVTHEFLKHYQNQGILMPLEVSDANYRYYDKRNASTVLEAIKNRNYGFSVKEIEKLFRHSTTSEVLEQMKPKMAELEKRIRRDQAILDEYRKLQDFCDQTAKPAWYVKEMEAFWFLPHVDLDGFVKDERVYEILSRWTANMPIVKSCQLCPAADPRRFVWGLSVSAKLAQQHQIPDNGSVFHFPRERVFEYNSITPIRADESSPVPEALRIMAGLHLMPCGPIYRDILMYTEYHNEGCVEHSRIRVPFVEK